MHWKIVKRIAVEEIKKVGWMYPGAVKDVTRRDEFDAWCMHTAQRLAEYDSLGFVPNRETAIEYIRRHGCGIAAEILRKIRNKGPNDPGPFSA